MKYFETKVNLLKHQGGCSKFVVGVFYQKVDSTFEWLAK